MTRVGSNDGGALDPRRIEEAGLNAMQTQRQLFYDGWLLRLSAGKAKRGRSVNAHFGSTLPLDHKIEYCEQVYARHGLAPLFRMTPFNCPADLEVALDARGYVSFDETMVQAVGLESAPDLPAAADGVEIVSLGVDAFVETTGDLRGSSEAHRDGHRERLMNSPLDKRCVAIRTGGRDVCTAQVAIEGGLVGVYDVVTAEDSRGKGYATAACASLLSWAWQHGATAAYLQVNEDNVPALAIYRKFGFATVYTYHYRGPPGKCE
jgi:GNAT superfamily N-acetyltransferase